MAYQDYCYKSNLIGAQNSNVKKYRSLDFVSAAPASIARISIIGLRVVVVSQRSVFFVHNNLKRHEIDTAELLNHF